MQFAATCIALLFLQTLPVCAQNASLVGTVRDSQYSTVPSARIRLIHQLTGVTLTTTTGDSGTYAFPLVHPGPYALRIERFGFKTYEQRKIALTVDQRARIDLMLAIGDISTFLSVEENAGRIQVETASLGEVIETKNVLELPLNGRYFLDLVRLTPGTTVQSTNNRIANSNITSIGPVGISASGAREDSTNYLFDGVNLSDMAQNQISFQPNVDMIQEFKVQIDAFSAEYGRNAGMIINAVSRSGLNQLHATAFEFIRNDAFDARNYFDRPGTPIRPFKRNIFGYSIGGPIVRNRTFFFTSYEGRRGRESSSIRALVPSSAQRDAATNPVIRALLAQVPEANAAGSFFVQAIPKRRDLDQLSLRLDHAIGSKHLLFATLISSRDTRTEPTLQGNNLPGFGDSRPARRYFAAFGVSSSFGPHLTNDLRAGVNRVRIDFVPDAEVFNPQDFGIQSDSPAFPRVVVAGAMAFGGIAGFPQARGDTTFQYTDTVSWVAGKHSLKFGAEWRRFRNNVSNGGTGGTITFASIQDFISGTPNSTTQQTVPANPALRVSALNLFIQDDYKITRRFAVNYGFRYEYNGIPSETHNRLAVYDFGSGALVPVGRGGVSSPYDGQKHNFGPRFGFSIDPSGKGRTVIRAGGGLYYDQPVTNLTSSLGSNPPFAGSVSFVSSPQKPLTFDLTNPFGLPGGGPTIFNAFAVAPDFHSGLIAHYNLTLQHEQFRTVFQASYSGSAGSDLRLSRDYNQGINSIRPNAAFGAITITESSSRSNYNALWFSANRRFSTGLTLSASYTFSKSTDLNSVGSANPQLQDSNNIAAEHALSDFDARHRFVLSGVYLLPFTGNGRLKYIVEGWSLSPIVNLQSGNPFSPILPTSRSGSLQNFDRPDVVIGQPVLLASPSPAMWLNPRAFTQNAIGTFGNAGRNILTGPGFEDIDFSIAKATRFREKYQIQLRAECFNILNHPNLAQPGNVFGSQNYGVITATRAARGDLGSSRQIQLGVRFAF